MYHATPNAHAPKSSIIFYTLVKTRSSTTNRNLSSMILPNIQLHQALLLLNNQTLLVSQMQQTDEAVAGRDVVHGLLGVDALQVLHDGCELQTSVFAFLDFGLGCGETAWCARW